MMQLIVLAIVLAILVHDAALDGFGFGSEIGPWMVTLLAVLCVLLAGSYTVACRWTLGRLALGQAGSLLRRLDAVTALYRLAVLGLYGTGLYLGLLTRIRRVMGDWVLVDELVVLLWPLVMMVWAWWAYHPIDERLRQAPLMRYLDQGLPVEPVWSRTQYLVAQVRHQLVLMLVPLLLTMGWVELVDRHTPPTWSIAGRDPRPFLAIVGAGTVFFFTPVLIRHLWDTAPLPAGPLRDRLEAMCDHYHVGVRQLLLWRTYGGLINGAVMGLVSAVRYILLTDALLQTLPKDRIEAVMAHELAHILRHHMFWLVTSTMALLGALAVIWSTAIELVARLNETLATSGGWGAGRLFLDHPELAACLAIGATVVSWVAAFGWVSRRFERQADTFAVAHLARRQTPGTPVSRAPLIDDRSVGVVTQALQQVADLNHVPTSRRSWRHGSIAWRQTYLRRLVGTRVDRQPIDWQVGAIKWASTVTIGVLAVMRWVCPQRLTDWFLWVG